MPHPGADLASFSIPPSVRTKLLKAGFKATTDLDGVGALELSKDAQISREEALGVLKEVREGKAPASQKAANVSRSALDILHTTRNLSPIITFCGEMDGMLGGGVPMGEVTEFVGTPGIGKTQLGIQLAVDAHLPQIFGGAEGEAVYIDTEGSFMSERAFEIAEAFTTHVHKMARIRHDEATTAAANALSAEGIMEKTYVYRVHDFCEQISCIKCLPDFLDDHPKVKLIVIDSIAFHFRHDFEDFAQRSRLLNSMAQQLTQMATNRGIAVVIINQVTTKLNGASGAAAIAPALGETWAHASTNRVMLYWENKQRVARLYKSASRKEGTASYCVTKDGVRGVPRIKRKERDSGEAEQPSARSRQSEGDAHEES